MKYLFLVIISMGLTISATASAADFVLDYDVTEAQCFGESSASDVECPKDYYAVKLTKPLGEEYVMLSIQVSQTGSVDTWFLKHEEVSGLKRVALSYDDELKRLVYTRSGEVFSTPAEPDLLISTISETLNFYQISDKTAVLVLSYVVVERDSSVEIFNVKLNLTKK